MLVALLTLALLAALGLGFHVFSAAPGRPQNRAFAAFAWLMALWLLNDIIFWGFAGLDEDGRGWARAAFLIGLAMQAAFLRFAWVFPEARPIPWRRAWPFVAAYAAVLPPILAGRATGPVGFRGGEFSIAFTPWTFAAGAVLYVTWAAGRILLERARRGVADPLLRGQVTALAFAATLTSVLASLAIVVLPLLGVYDLLPYAGLSILVGTVLHAYSVLEFRLLLPVSVLDRVRLFPVTAKVALAIAGAGLIAVAVVLGVARAALGPGLEGWPRAAVFGLVAASVPAMALIYVVQRIVTRPLRAITEAAIEVAGGRTDVRVAAQAGDEIGVLAAAFNDMVDRLSRDLQALRDMGEGLLRAERLATAGALAAGVAHEVNNPLAAVSSLVQTARGRIDDPATRDLLDEAVAQMERVAGALRDLMELARPRPVARRACDLGAIVEATVRLLRYDRRFRSVPVQTKLAPDLPPIDADPDRIQQVLLNLLLNARDAIDGVEGGAIEVSTAPREGGVDLVVADTGRGIAKEDVDRIFEPFFTTKPTGAGTGLGLAVCREIVQEHGGRIAVESGVGEGTRVRVELPVE